MDLLEKFNKQAYIDLLEKNAVKKSSQAQYVSQTMNFIKFISKYEKLTETEFITAMNEYLLGKRRCWHARFAIRYFMIFINKKDIYDKFYNEYHKKYTMQTRKLEKKSISFEKLKQLCYEIRMPYKLAVMIQYDTALRASDVLSLTVNNIEMDEDGMIKVKKKELKTGKIRTVFISPDSAYMLAKYIKDKELNNDDKIFKVSYESYNWEVKRSGKVIGEPDISTHWIRCSRAVHLIEKKYDIMTIKKILGHASINATQTYIEEAGLSNKEVMLKERPVWQ